VPATVSTDQLFQFICRLQASNNRLWEEERHTNSEENIVLDPEIKAEISEAVDALNQAQSKFESSYAYPFFPGSFFEEKYLDAVFGYDDNPVTVITDYLKLVFVDSYSTDEGLSFFAKDVDFELTNFEKDFFCELIRDLLMKIEDQNIVGFLEIAIFDRYNALREEDWPGQEYLDGQKRFQDLICVSDQYSQSVFSAVLFAALRMEVNFQEEQVMQFALDHFLEKPIGRCEPHGIPVAYVRPLLAAVSAGVKGVDVEIAEQFVREINEAQAVFGNGRAIFTMLDSSLIWFHTLSNFKSMLPAAVQFGMSTETFVGPTFSRPEAKSINHDDRCFHNLVKASIDEKLYRIASATTAVWILLAVIQLEGKFPRWARIAEVIEELKGKPGFLMAEKSLEQAFLFAKESKEQLTVQLLESYVDPKSTKTRPPGPVLVSNSPRPTASGRRREIEDELKDQLQELFVVITKEGWRTYVDAHLKFKKLQDGASLGGGITEWGNISAEFAKIFEIELRHRLTSIYQDELYKKFKSKGGDHYPKNPTLGQYLRMLGEYKRLPTQLRQKLDRIVRLQHDPKLIKRLVDFNFNVRNKGFHTEHVPLSGAQKTIELMHGVKGEEGLLIPFLRALKPPRRKNFGRIIFDLIIL
jgi:hypothetical protein